MKIISNNPMVIEKYKESYAVDGSPLDVLMEVRKHLQSGHELVTMPLPANQRLFMNPYRSIVVKKTASPGESRGPDLVEKAIERFRSQVFNYDPEVEKDFAVIDCEQIMPALQSDY